MSTPAQPLDVFGCPLDGVRLIEASAGTGKTWNLCGLYLRLLLDAQRPLPVEQILVVSFTNAATAELRERIRQRIADVLAALEGRGLADADPFVPQLLASLRARGDDNDRLRRLLTRALRGFDEAAILTIHGFCQRALDDAPFTAGLPLRQDLLEDDSELRQQAANDFWRRHVAGAALPPGLARWLLHRRDSPYKLAKLLQRHAGKPLSQVLWPPGDEAAAPGFGVLQRLYDTARALWVAGRGDIAECVQASLPSLDRRSYTERGIAEALGEWDAAFAAADVMGGLALGPRARLLASARYQPGRGKPACRDHAFFAAAQDLLDAWEPFRVSLEQARTALLRRLVEEGTAALADLKRQRRVVAFDDMLSNLHRELGGRREGALAAALRARFPAALIDEFQDTDPLQFAIFDTVYGGRTDTALFLVGDPKQAIYSFRNADLHTYLQARAAAQAEYTLAQNQRSSPALIEALNGLFGRNPRAFMLPGLPYRPVAAGTKPRKPFEDGTRPRGALHLWNLPEGADGQALLRQDAVAAATQACAAEIARLLGQAQAGRILHDGRPLAAGDIAVLVRSHAEGSRMRAALAQLRVGSVELAQASVFGSPDAEQLEHVLRAVLEPGRPGLLRAALATELLGLDALGLEALAADEAATLERTRRFGEYRTAWQARGIGPMLRELVAIEGVHRRLLARPDGERRLTNLHHLAECLHAASREHPAPESLLRWLQRQRSDPPGGEATQLRLESDRNLVQIVTIHKSKGLEYPVVFCPYLWSGQPGGGNGGMGCEYHDDEGRHVIDYREIGRDDPVRRRLQAEQDAERLRLAYVALTRAVHRCYLVVGAYVKRSGRGFSGRECTGNPLNWLVAGAGTEPQAWRDQEIDGAGVVAAWQALAAAHPQVIGFEPLPHEAGVALAPPRIEPAQISALPAPQRISAGWRRGSYTGLAHGARHEQAAVDHDLRARRRDAAAAARVALPDDDILRFPGGAREGICMHAAFEEADFADAGTWPAAVAAALRRHPPAGGAAAQGLAPMLLRLLQDVLATPLPAGFTLSQVPRGRRLVELEFHLTVPHLDVGQLQALLRRHGYASPDLGRQVLAGYLHGFIDLVLEHGGRFHILDWKSNHLGWREQDYGREGVQQAMDANGYHLQYLLYTIAVHRWLQRRLPGYGYERHFGGIQYLFVRGVRPQWRDDGGSARGVFFHTPSLAVVQDLEALFGQAQERVA